MKATHMSIAGKSRTDRVKRSVPFMVAGILVCGILGSFIAGPEGRALGGGIGAVVGLGVGGLIGKYRAPAA
jgi:hypothetical protein